MSFIIARDPESRRRGICRVGAMVQEVFFEIIDGLAITIKEAFPIALSKKCAWPEEQVAIVVYLDPPVFTDFIRDGFEHSRSPNTWDVVLIIYSN